LAAWGAGIFLSFAFAEEPEVIEGNPLVPIEGGEFVFGNDAGEENERPQSTVTLPGFAMNRTEITNEQYRRFVAETGHRPSFYDGNAMLGLGERPVVGVSWWDASEFCRHYGLSLPSEQEFERAARGIEGGAFPWGDAPVDPMRVSGGGDECCGEDERDGYRMTAPVDAFESGRSAEGVLNLIGNVWEWTRDWYAPYEGEPDPATARKFRVLRGGAWNSDPSRLSSTYRLAFDPDFRFAANGGFRCVRTGPQS
jgi:iron(II)-dependent oxidoreductase